MIKQITAAQAATFEVSGINFYDIHGMYRAITETAVIFFEPSAYSAGIGIIEKSDAPNVYNTYLNGCVTIGKEITKEEFVAGAKSIVGAYAEKINFIMEAVVASEIFSL